MLVWERITTLGCLALLLGVACAAPEPPPPEPSSETQRELAQGTVVGFETEDGAHAWQGIPFAKPPVGELRWKAPRPAEPWSGRREAIGFGSSCPQFPGFSQDADAAEGQPVGDEDCLYLNVYAPKWAPDAVPTGADRLPVMVWIHGGGNSVGDAAVYDGSRLANHGPVVVVTIHYRLGILGWFTHPALREGQTAADASGNYGTLDVIAALEWVKNNISAFGGDPNRVVVFGESAGGTDTHAMLLSPRAEGLFHGAIAQSGTATTMPLHEAENFVDDARAGAPFSSREILLHLLQEDGKASDRATAKAALAEMSGTETAAYLRTKTPAELLTFFDGESFGGMYPSTALLEDGFVLPEISGAEAYAAGRFNRVPAILGTNRDEVKLFAMAGSHNVTQLFGIPLWVNDPDQYDASSEYGTKKWKLQGVDDPARGMRKYQDGVWAYRFDWDELRSPLGWDLPGIVGAAHALEIPFVFGWMTLGPATALAFDPANEATDRALSDAMMSYWTQFAYAGDPGRGRNGDLPAWPAWNPAPGGPKMLLFDTSNDGGIRPSSDEVDMPTILEQVRADPRLSTQRDRCEVLAELSRLGPEFDAAQYTEYAAGECSDYPLADYPWTS